MFYTQKFIVVILLFYLKMKLKNVKSFEHLMCCAYLASTKQIVEC